jgi:transcriptional regulator with XRE-family HTH domain
VAKGKQKRPDTLEQACGRLIAKYRERLGLSQMDLAVATGYSLRYMGDIERGRKSATLRTLNDLATLFDVRLGFLISEAESLLSGKRKEDQAYSAGNGNAPRRLGQAVTRKEADKSVG